MEQNSEMVSCGTQECREQRGHWRLEWGRCCPLRSLSQPSCSVWCFQLGGSQEPTLRISVATDVYPTSVSVPQGVSILQHIRLTWGALKTTSAQVLSQTVCIQVSRWGAPASDCNGQPGWEPLVWAIQGSLQTQRKTTGREVELPLGTTRTRTHDLLGPLITSPMCLLHLLRPIPCAMGTIASSSSGALVATREERVPHWIPQIPTFKKGQKLWPDGGPVPPLALYSDIIVGPAWFVFMFLALRRMLGRLKRSPAG